MTSTALTQPIFGTATEVELATFYAADLLLGIPIHKVEEISRYCAITPVPGAPASVCGVMSLRGEVVTVLDLRVVLGLGKTECTRQTRNVIVQAAGERIGLLVDRVADVVRAATADLLPPPANMSGAESTMFQAVYRMESELLVLLDVAAVTAAPVAT
ncbi:MAG: chemotaxis protein CheW [Thermoguttaceae bacterium]